VTLAVTHRSACTVAVVLASLLIAASAQVDGASSNYFPFESLGESFWHIAKDSRFAPALPDLILWIDLETLTARTRCHATGQAFLGPRDHLKFSNYFMSSSVSGPPCNSEGAQFDAFQKEMTTSALYSTTGDELAFTDRTGKEIVHFIRAHPDGVENRRLKIVQYFKLGNLAVPSEETERVDIVFFGGSIEGSPGCGGFTGSYEWIDSSTLKIFASWILAGSCFHIDQIVKQNDRVTDDLDGVRIVRRASQNVFELRDPQGGLRLILEAQ
jgi:hypothetical protein